MTSHLERIFQQLFLQFSEFAILKKHGRHDKRKRTDEKVLFSEKETEENN